MTHAPLSALPLRPTTRRDDTGLRLVGRRTGQRAGSVLVCPDNQRAGRVIVPAGGFVLVACPHADQLRAHSAPTDLHWLCALDEGPHQAPLVLECHPDEARHIERARLSAAEVRAYLGAPPRREAAA